MKKKSLFLGLGGGVLALVIAAGVLLFALGNKEKAPVLYRNLDGHLYSHGQQRQPDESGVYRLRFAADGVVTELTCSEEATVRYIDTMDVLGLEVDKDGNITAAMDANTLAWELCEYYHIQSVSPTQLAVNSSLAMNGISKVLILDENTRIYDVSQAAVTVLSTDDLLPMDGVTAYGNEAGVATHIFVNSHPVESPVYWRTARMYSSSTKETTREPDENGVFSLDFYCDGEIVTLTCKDKETVTAIDLVDADIPHFGFRLDEEGHIVQILNSALSLRGLLACENYDVTELTETGLATLNQLSGKAEVWTGQISENCRIYDISDTAYAEGRMGQQVDSLQVGDRITAWTDTENRTVLVYVTNRLVDCPIFYSATRKYDSKTKQTTREPDADGWYTVSLLKEGDTQAQDYKTKDKALMSYLDSTSSRCVGVVADDNNVLQRVYMPQCLFGRSVWSSGGVVASSTGSIVVRMTYGSASSVANGVMMPDCKIYNVSTTGSFGKPTTLQAGDYIYAFRQPSGELVHIYVVRRCLGADTMYYNLDRQYDSETKQTTRESDVEGYYHFTFAHNGQIVKLKTGSKAMADAIDALSPGAVSLLTTADIIDEVNAPNYACGGSQVANGYQYVGLDEKGRHLTRNESEKETTFKMAADCVIYDVQGGNVTVKEALEEGDILTVYTNRNGEARIIFVQ